MTLNHPDGKLTRRARLYRLFEGWDHPGARTTWVDWLLIVLILSNVAAVTLESMGDLYQRYSTAFDVFELISVIIFAVEYGARVWLSVEDPMRKGQGPVMARIRYMLTPMAIVDLIAFLPVALLILFGGGVDLRMLRVVRVIRILKIARYSVAIQIILSVFRSEGRTLLAAFLIVVIALYLSATAIYLAEHKVQPEAFGSIPASMWWAMATLTTVGYGDVVPVTVVGRVIGGLVMISGIGLFVVWTGIFASAFSDELRRRAFRVSWELVSAVPAFKGLSALEISAIAQYLKTQVIPARYMILRRGERSEALFFIVNGMIEIELESGVEQLGPGEFFGESGLIGGRAMKASVIALTDTSLLVLDNASFHHLMETHQEIRDHVHEMAQRRDHWHLGEGQT